MDFRVSETITQGISSAYLRTLSKLQRLKASDLELSTNDCKVTFLNHIITELCPTYSIEDINTAILNNQGNGFPSDLIESKSTQANKNLNLQPH